MLEGEHTEHRGEAGGPDGHALEEAESLRTAHHPLRANPLALSESSRVGLRQSEPGDEDLVARLPGFRCRFLDHSGHVDATYHREAADDASLAGDGEPVLVIEARVLDRHCDIALGEVVVGQLGELTP